MSLNEISMSLFEEMENELAKIEVSTVSDIQSLKSSSSVILKTISRLKDYIIAHEFLDKEEEINFFKNIKPKFLSKLIYYHKVFEIQSNLPFGSVNEIKIFYQKELNKIVEYLNENKDFYSYYRANLTLFDEAYFLRKEPESWVTLNFDDYETDLNFTTIYDHKRSKIIAFESLSGYIKAAISDLDPKNDLAKKERNGEKSITWTGSKVSLIELLYAIQSAGSCNNGTIDVKTLATHLENVFNIDLGNYYRVFQEIRIRKTSRTSFLEQLKDRLLRRMDDADENPKNY